MHKSNLFVQFHNEIQTRKLLLKWINYVTKSSTDMIDKHFKSRSFTFD